MAKKKRKPGRPAISDEESRVVCFRVPMSLYRRIEDIAEKDRRGVSDMLRLLIEKAVSRKK